MAGAGWSDDAALRSFDGSCRLVHHTCAGETAKPTIGGFRTMAGVRFGRFRKEARM